MARSSNILSDHEKVHRLVRPPGHDPIDAIEEAMERTGGYCEACAENDAIMPKTIELEVFQSENLAPLCEECLSRPDWRDAVRERRRNLQWSNRNTWRSVIGAGTDAIKAWFSDPTATWLWGRRFGLLTATVAGGTWIETSSVKLAGWALVLFVALTALFHAVERAANDPTGWMYSERSLTVIRGRLLSPWLHVAIGTVLSFGAAATLILPGVSVPLSQVDTPVVDASTLVAAEWAAGIAAISYYIEPSIKVDADRFDFEFGADHRAAWVGLIWFTSILSVGVIALGITSLFRSIPPGAADAIEFVALTTTPGLGLLYTILRTGNDSRVQQAVIEFMDRVESLRDRLIGRLAGPGDDH